MPEYDEPQWQITVTVPQRLPVERRNELFEAVASAVSEWEPDERDGWDADVSGQPLVVEPAKPEIGKEDLAVIGDYLCEYIDECTCEGEPHREGCGYEQVYPVATVRDVLSRDLSSETHPHPADCLGCHRDLVACLWKWADELASHVAPLSSLTVAEKLRLLLGTVFTPLPGEAGASD